MGVVSVRIRRELQFMETEEHIELNTEERIFLKRICVHWKEKQKPLIFSSYSYSANMPYLTVNEKVASMKLVTEDLVEVDLCPSTESLPYNPDINFPIANTSIHIKAPTPDKFPITFYILYTPTKRGLDNCFVEEL